MAVLEEPDTGLQCVIAVVPDLKGLTHLFSYNCRAEKVILRVI